MHIQLDLPQHIHTAAAVIQKNKHTRSRLQQLSSGRVVVNGGCSGGDSVDGNTSLAHAMLFAGARTTR